MPLLKKIYRPSFAHPLKILFTSRDPQTHLKDRKGRPAAFMIEQVDGDRFCFPSHDDGERFMAIHGLTPVSDAEMEKARVE